MDNKIQNSMCVSPRFAMSPSRAKKRQTEPAGTESQSNSVAFKGARSNFIFRKLSETMSNPSEMSNAVIQAIGTAVVAPLAILVSPSRKNDGLTKEQRKEKKEFQAYRQPVSAVLAFGFQFPTTLGIGRLLDKLTFEKHNKMFDDEILGSLTPTKKYYTRQISKILKKGMTDTTIPKIDGYNGSLDVAAYKEEYRQKLISSYEEVGLKVDEKAVNKKVNSKTRLRNFIADKIAGEKANVVTNEKIEEILQRMRKNNIEIKDIDLVTEDYQNLARHREKELFKNFEKQNKISFYDTFTDWIGFPTKKMQKYKKAEGLKAKEIGLELLKKDEPKLFTEGVTEEAKMRHYIKNLNKKAQDTYGKKTFWITLVTNLVMLGISCYVLNWLHPKFVKLLEKIKHRNDDNSVPDSKKVEVKA